MIEQDVADVFQAPELFCGEIRPAWRKAASVVLAAVVLGEAGEQVDQVLPVGGG